MAVVVPSLCVVLVRVVSVLVLLVGLMVILELVIHVWRRLVVVVVVSLVCLALLVESRAVGGG